MKSTRTIPLVILLLFMPSLSHSSGTLNEDLPIGLSFSDGFRYSVAGNGEFQASLGHDLGIGGIQKEGLREQLRGAGGKVRARQPRDGAFERVGRQPD